MLYHAYPNLMPNKSQHSSGVLCVLKPYTAPTERVLCWTVAINILLLRIKGPVLVSNQDERQRNTTFKIELFY